MTWVACALAALAMWWWVPRSPVARVEPPVGVPLGRVRLEAAYAVTLIVVVVCAGSLAGPSAAAATIAVGVVVGGVCLVVRGRWRDRRRERLADDVARACSALAQELSIGRVPATALASAAGDFEVLRPAASMAAVGGDVLALWEVTALTPGAEGLGRLARAWGMAETTGAPLAATLDAVAERLREDRQVAATVNAELAASRMTGRLLTGLPVAGLGIGFGIGGDPVAFLLDNLIGQACLVVGSVLAVVGLLWTERMGRT